MNFRSEKHSSTFNSIRPSSIQIRKGVCDSHLCECVFALSTTPPHVASFRKPAELIDDGFIVWVPAPPDIMIVYNVFLSICVSIFCLVLAIIPLSYDFNILNDLMFHFRDIAHRDPSFQITAIAYFVAVTIIRLCLAVLKCLQPLQINKAGYENLKMLMAHGLKYADWRQKLFLY